jgi:hypothetical protein
MQVDRDAVIAAIEGIRRKAAANFSPEFMGNQGEAYDRAVLDIWKAIRALPATNADNFSVGDNVVHTETGWIGVVEGHKSDNGLVYCRFRDVGQFGANPIFLQKIAAHTAIKALDTATIVGTSHD